MVSWNPSGYNEKRILVTGGAGCIGSNLVRTLLMTQASEIVVIDDLPSAKEALFRN